MRPWIVGIAAVMMLAGAATQAHHSIAGVYDSAREATVDGIVTQFRFARPHPWIDLRETGSGQSWRLEMDDLGELETIHCCSRCRMAWTSVARSTKRAAIGSMLFRSPSSNRPVTYCRIAVRRSGRPSPAVNVSR